MAFLRKGSKYYQIRRRRLIGFGDTGQLSSGTKNKKLADRMEQAIEDLAERALIEPRYRSLVEAVCCDHTVAPADLLVSRHDLDKLLVTLNDPTLRDAVDAFRAGTAVSNSSEIGLKQLLLYAPSTARLSYLDAKTITSLCRTAMQAPEKEGVRQRNSVVRCFKRAVSQLLRFHLGNAARNAIFADVLFSSEDDTREVHLGPEDIHRLLEACHSTGYPELAVIVQTALLTSADRGVLLKGTRKQRQCRGLLVSDVRVFHDGGEYWGTVYLSDPKTAGRTRTVTIPGFLAQDLLALAAGKAPHDPIFDLEYQQLDYRWHPAREAAGLKHLRFKDLRAQISQYGEEAGVPLTVLVDTMGHGDEAMTRRYQRRQTAFTREHAEAIGVAMGIASLQPSLQSVSQPSAQTA